MAESDIYGNLTETLLAVRKKLELQALAWNREAAQRGEHECFEHLTSRVETECNMWDRLLRRGLEETTKNALCRLTDVIDLRIVTRLVDDICRVKAKLVVLSGVEIVEEKGYIQNVKPSGCRSLHFILCRETDAPDFYGRVPRQFFVEVRIRTIVMDSQASLEHGMYYKWEGGNCALIVAELKHVADDLAPYDLSMQMIRNMTREEEA